MRCPACGTTFEADARFCANCGRLRSGPASTSDEPIAPGAATSQRWMLVAAVVVASVALVVAVRFDITSRGTGSASGTGGVTVPDVGGNGEDPGARGDCPCPRWTAELPGERLVDPVSVGVVGGTLLVGDGTGLTALDLASGARRWHRGDPVVPGGLVAAMLPHVVVGSPEGVIGIDDATGDTRWERRGARVLGNSSAWVLAAGSDAVAAIDRVDGRPLWERELAVVAAHAPAFALGRPVVLTRDGVLHGLHPLTGNDAWTLELDLAPPAVLVGDGALVVVGPDPHGSFVGVGALDGDVRWRVDLAEPRQALVLEGEVLVSVDDTGATALSSPPVTSDTLWEYDLDQVRGAVAGPFGLALAGRDGLTVVAPTTGDVILRVPTDVPTLAVAAVGSDVFVVRSDARVQAVTLPPFG